MNVINHSDVFFIQKRQKDEVNRVFSWEGRIFRGIYSGYEEHIHSLFVSGLLPELLKRNLIPKTWVSDVKMEGFSLILEHENIWPVVYPQEWTFSMLRDAALHVYQVGCIAKKYGYDMKDCHGLNILFKGTQPVYIDIGSFVKSTSESWMPYEEFLRFYFYPLNIWQKNNFVGKLSIFSGNLTSHENFLNYKYPAFRNLNSKWKRKVVDEYIRTAIYSSTVASLSGKRSKSGQSLRPRPLLKRVIKDILPFESFELGKVIGKIEKMYQEKTQTLWTSYHEENTKKTKRFERIIEILKTFDPVNTAIDIGGNQGKFSKMLSTDGFVKHVLCSDADENAIDTGYQNEKAALSSNITFAHFDFMDSIAKLRFLLPNQRFSAEAVFLLAITHHLILSQGYDIKDVFINVKSFSSKYVFIEFMPLGLWSTNHAPEVPEWYTQTWFRENFLQHFELIHEEQLRNNNILFVGKVK